MTKYAKQEQINTLVGLFRAIERQAYQVVCPPGDVRPLVPLREHYEALIDDVLLWERADKLGCYEELHRAAERAQRAVW
jgi:hypothetical protein